MIAFAMLRHWTACRFQRVYPSSPHMLLVLLAMASSADCSMQMALFLTPLLQLHLTRLGYTHRPASPSAISGLQARRCRR